ncbi:MAG: CIA30 family protein [Planctomycetota bacterium]
MSIAALLAVAFSTQITQPSDSAKANVPAQGVNEVILTDFNGEKVSAEWIVVNDNVMGGRSSGGPEFDSGVLTFTGSTNTNGGGFSSTRTVPSQWNLSDYDGLRMRVRGGGRTYLVEIRTDVTFRGRAVAYRAEFRTEEGDEWQEIIVPFAKFKPSSWGRDISEQVEVLDTSDIKTLGFMIYDGLDGTFKLEADWIKAVEIPSVECWFDFADPAEESQWRATTDGVMQDRPTATISIENDALIFSGQTASDEPLTPSARIDFPSRQLAPGGALELRVKGDGRAYALEIVTTETIRDRPVRFRGLFETTGDWEVVRVAVDDMSPLVYGRQLGVVDPRREPVEPHLDAITGLALVAVDRNPGQFRIECDDIVAVSETDDESE